MKVIDLYNAKGSLERISQIDLPIKASFKIVRLIEKFNKELAAVEPLRKKLFEKYGYQDGENMKIKEENKDAFQAEWSQLLDTDIHLEFTPIKVSEFGTEAKILPIDLFNLNEFIEEEPD